MGWTGINSMFMEMDETETKLNNSTHICAMHLHCDHLAPSPADVTLTDGMQSDLASVVRQPASAAECHPS